MLENPENKSKQPESKRWNTPPEVKLPFEKRQHEPGEWVYEHRIAISITIIIYLALAIVLVFTQVVIDSGKLARNEVLFDIEETKSLEELQKELQRAEELNDRLNQNNAVPEDFQNVVSNESAILDELARTDRQVEEMLRGSREMLEQGNEDIKLMESLEREILEEEVIKPRDTKVEGKVAVSYSFKNPMRTAANLYVPSYQCYGGGTVVVSVTINPKGEVLSASILKSSSTEDYCMTTTALDAAHRSKFHVHPAAPSRQTGTITYTFVPHE